VLLLARLPAGIVNFGYPVIWWSEARGSGFRISGTQVFWYSDNRLSWLL